MGDKFDEQSTFVRTRASVSPPGPVPPLFVKNAFFHMRTTFAKFATRIFCNIVTFKRGKILLRKDRASLPKKSPQDPYNTTHAHDRERERSLAKKYFGIFFRVRHVRNACT